jgi:hypothetical protein
VSFINDGVYSGVKSNETLTMIAVPKSSGYPVDGSDEDNTFAKFSPQADFRITIANPELWGKFSVGEKYYVDFTKAE